MATWRVGKTMVGQVKPVTEAPVAVTERQAKYKLGQLMRQTAMTYRSVTAPGDPHGWGPLLWRLEIGAEQLENGGLWLPSEHGLNWVWSLPWGSENSSDRDIWVFWVKVEGAGETGGDGAGVLVDGPFGGATRELATSGQAA